MSWWQKLDASRPAVSNSTYVERLLKELDKSEKVKKAVLLGLDGVYDKNGQLDLAQTDFLISNHYVLQVARNHQNHFLPGVSINPQRRDAIEELERCVQGGAVLVKVLPNTQGFDPSDRRYVLFYRALATRGIPLLSHAGYEFSLTGKDQSAGNPDRLRVALDEGVCVIAAHACSYGLFLPEPYFKVLIELADRYPHFYFDTSALTLPNRVRTLFLLRRHPELHNRLIFGTDYPLPVFSYPSLGRGYRKSVEARTPFDRQALVLESLGIHCRDFSSLVRS
jgi:predicted TIM-barrel fold metal-dependent hydrolase